MRLFISYARVDKPYCIQIVDTLDVHETWHDQRLYAGQNWWKEILRRLDWCEGFVYLLSPDSLLSEPCRKEFELAKGLGRHIFPVLVHPETKIPDEIKDIQYADFSRGMTAVAVRTLLNSIYLAEQNGEVPRVPLSAISPDAIRPPEADPSTVISAAADAMEEGHYDQAVFLLRQAKENGYTSSYINIDAFLTEAESSLEKQASSRVAQREYNQIASLIRHKATFKLGCEALDSFHQDFPDYDPDNLGEYCKIGIAPTDKQDLISKSYILNAEMLPMLKWCKIPAGEVEFQYFDIEKQPASRCFEVKDHYLSQYPVTNGQFDVFVSDPHGYADSGWWDFSPEAIKFRQARPRPVKSYFQGEERPREMVSWYDAVAFCRWLSVRLDLNITLPTHVEWQRAFQGDDQRIFPWGNTFNKKFCNTSESELKMTTMVNSFDDNVSPFGVQDMAGNVWEWCLNKEHDQDFSPNLNGDQKRIVRGGSFMSSGNRSMVNFYYALKPEVHYSSIGFRIAWHP